MKNIALSLILLLVACTQRSNENNAQTTEGAQENSTGCYSYVTDKDTVRLTIKSNTDSLSGELLYHYYEKDRNIGTFSGRMLGDTLLADYTFQSEGVSSVRQVVFMKTDSGFVEGYGNTTEQNGRMVFSNRRYLQFNSDVQLKKTACD